ncbi:SDR family NAD(P)-dependent oxidoreductase [Trabulsiella odontotermitis]|uniref:Oxidoreductase n=1 Tax=Trabulsiella odontotermitis TaxID=379893 RepID=A0A0L0GTE1_9ENTR|nr:glucose 1-dehydrogenase [Trabulsiella odontotermitis]KNC91708.1 oxidoreductase [Trabulsiella odontotermitis]KNC92890.1 oxidoreductase [Trabulsiella odontotermitis]
MKLFEGKVAIVTGASRGIGAEIARQFAREGASVVVNYARDRAAAEKVVSDIQREGGSALAVQGNVTSSHDVSSVFQAAVDTFGSVDIVVNNAGVFSFGPIDEFTEASFHEQFGINVLGVLLTTKAFVQHFGSGGGSIINISSVANRTAPAHGSVYAATKAAVDAITRSLAKELGPRNIRVNAISPGGVETEGTHAANMIGNDFEADWISRTPLGRFGRTTDIAPVALFLASEASGWITGENIVASGGYF